MSDLNSSARLSVQSNPSYPLFFWMDWIESWDEHVTHVWLLNQWRAHLKIPSSPSSQQHCCGTSYQIFKVVWLYMEWTYISHILWSNTTHDASCSFHFKNRTCWSAYPGGSCTHHDEAVSLLAQMVSIGTSSGKIDVLHRLARTLCDVTGESSQNVFQTIWILPYVMTFWGSPKRLRNVFGLHHTTGLIKLL